MTKYSIAASRTRLADFLRQILPLLLNLQGNILAKNRINDMAEYLINTMKHLCLRIRKR